MLYAIDTKLFYFFNVSLKNFLLDFLMPLFARHEEWIPVAILFTLAGLYSDRRKCLRAVLLGVAALALSDFLIHNFLKPLWGRVRPCNALPLGTFNLMVGCGGSYSFPSQHASNIFAVMISLAYCYRRAKYVLILVASLVAFSRVYLGVHYPSDVFFGAIFGICSACLLIGIMNRVKAPRKDECTKGT